MILVFLCFCCSPYSFVLPVLLRAAQSEESPARQEEISSPCCLFYIVSYLFLLLEHQEKNTKTQGENVMES